MTQGNDERSGKQLPPRSWSSPGLSSLFRCHRCSGNKHTLGRKYTQHRGARVWVCASCLTAAEAAA
jgi:hypothetical protein